MANNLYRWQLFISTIQKKSLFLCGWRIMRQHNDLPQGFQISATSHCCNEKCYNWLWKWASQSRDGLLCTWRLPAANRKKFSKLHNTICVMSHRLDLQQIHICITTIHADLQQASALQFIIMVNVYGLNIYQCLALAELQKTVWFFLGKLIICTEM